MFVLQHTVSINYSLKSNCGLFFTLLIIYSKNKVMRSVLHYVQILQSERVVGLEVSYHGAGQVAEGSDASGVRVPALPPHAS